MAKYCLCGDIGGTNDDLAAVKIEEGSCEIVFKEDRSTQRHQDFPEVVNDFLQDLAEAKDITVKKACFAAAGPVEDQRVEMAHADLVIDAEEIERRTELEQVHVINDFDAIGYGINQIDKEDYLEVQDGENGPGKPVAVIGAGTGLGKNLLVYDSHIDSYISQSSEGGHADLPLFSTKELELARFIKKKQGLETEVSYEDVLSGQGLENIYGYLQSGYSGVPEDIEANEISASKGQNPCSRETFRWFIRFYARCCRNYALDTLPENGLYIAGGVPARNTEEFDRTFLEEFRNVSPQFQELLSDIPVRLITNEDIAIEGVAYALNHILD